MTEADLVIHIDGACSGNPGPAGIGIVIRKDGGIIKEISEPIGDATNNIAEYTALIEGLKAAREYGARVLQFYTDSQLMQKQVTGQYKVKDLKIKQLFDEIGRLSKHFKELRIQHVPRAENADADRLASGAIKMKQTGPVVAPLFKNSGEESPSSTG